MNLFGLEGSGFIISIGLTLLMSGLVVYYFNAKFHKIEEAVARQNQVLSSFIANVQGELRGGGAGGLPGPQMSGQTSAPVSNLATEEAEEAARQFNNNEVPQDKIEVSDDDSQDEDDSDSEDDDSEDNDSEDNDSEDDTPTLSIGDVALDDGVRVVEMLKGTTPEARDDELRVEAALVQEVSALPLGGDSDNNGSKTIALNLHTETPSDSDEDSDDDDDSMETDDGTSADAETGEAQLEALDIVKIDQPDEDGGNSSEDSGSSVASELNMDIKKMRVKELKKLISNKGLASPAVVKGMKKQELIELLSK